jgi:DNA-binding transcriptional LysR family regulator
MDVQTLITFRTIVSAGGFAKAAAQLGFTQSTVTFQMQRLEQELATKLFEKIGRDMRLTDAGRRVLPLADAIIDSLEQMKQTVRPDGEVSGALTVAMSETLLAFTMQEVLRHYRMRAPKAKLTFLSKPCAEILEAVKSGTIDVGIIYDAGAIHDHIEVKPLFSVPMALVASGTADGRIYDFLTPNRTIHTNFFVNEPKCVFREIFFGYLKRMNIVLDSTIELGSIETIRKSVANNLGVSYLPRFIVEDELGSGVLRELPMDHADEVIRVCYATRKNKWISPAMDLFIRLVQEHIRRPLPKEEVPALPR